MLIVLVYECFSSKTGPHEIIYYEKFVPDNIAEEFANYFSAVYVHPTDTT